jgi:glycosyltransferase involved in cell wall biosynthesis
VTSAGLPPRPTLLFLVTEDWYFVSHRLELARAARAAGYRVVVATRVQSHAAPILEAGCELVALRWRRSGNHPWSHLLALQELTALYARLRPDLVHHVALKAVIFGSIAARRTGVPRTVNALAGLGFVFASPTLRARLLRPLLKRLLRRALGGPNQRVIVQNRDDRRTLVEAGLVPAERVIVIRGAGVEPTQYPEADVARQPPLVVLVARMLWEKGVGEFVGAAVELRRRGLAARWVLVGDTDPDNPRPIDRAQLLAWQESGAVEWWGHREDVPAILAQAGIYALPTRYGEGIPRSLLEAAAAGLALVTTDTSGCREVVEDEVTGLLVSPGDPAALADALERLISDPVLRVRLGGAARLRVAKEFALTGVIESTLQVYRELLA